MTQVIVYTNENGNVSVCNPAPEYVAIYGIEAVKNKDTPKNSIIIDFNSLPNEHRNFFDAWELINEKVEVNFSKAIEITKQRLRIEREPLLQAQDVLFQRALEAGADTTAIVAEKQRLRDITKLADQATTLDELKAIEVK